MQDGQKQRVEDYLQRVSEALGDLPDRERAEILDDLRNHLSEAAGGDVRFATEADIRNALDRLGDPEDVAREARILRGHEDLPRTSPRKSKYEAEHSHTPGPLEVAAIVLTALMWPVGIVLAWISDRWRPRDKIIATIIPLTSALILGAIVIGGMVFWESGGSSATLVYEQAEPAGPAQDPAQTEPRSPTDVSEPASGDGIFGRMVVILGFLGGAIVAPFVAAVFLAIRMVPASQAGGARMDSEQIHGAASTMPGTRAW